MLKDLIEEKSKELAVTHAQIIEIECQKVLERFKCTPEDLIIEYHGHMDIKINVKASFFRITNCFYYDHDKIESTTTTIDL
jgi:hypothetical protein